MSMKSNRDLCLTLGSKKKSSQRKQASYYANLPIEDLGKEADERHLEVRVGVSVDPVVCLDHDVALAVSLEEALVLPGGDVQGQPGRVEAASTPLETERGAILM